MDYHAGSAQGRELPYGDERVLPGMFVCQKRSYQNDFRKPLVEFDAS